MSLWPLIGSLVTTLVLSAQAQAAHAKKSAPRPAKALPAAPPAEAPAAELAPGQLDAAGRVLTGDMACEFDQTVLLRPIDGQRGHFRLDFKKVSYTLVPQETTTGAVRLEDRKAGVVWLQIATKSMLLNAKTGNRMVDSCLHEAQRHAVAPAGSSLGIEPRVAGAESAPGALVVASAPVPTEPLVPRQVLFGDAPQAGGSVSPDGKWLAWLAPKDGVLNVWVAPATAPGQSRVLTDERQRGIRGVRFARDGRHLLYAQDEAGSQSSRIHAVDLAGGAARALSPKGSNAAIAGLSDAYPGEVLLSVNDRDARHFDLVRVDLASGKSTRVLENDGFSGVVTDAGFRPRYAKRQRADGGTDWFVRAGESWLPWSAVPRDDVLGTAVVGLSSDGRTVYVEHSRGGDAPSIHAVDTQTGVRRLVRDEASALAASGLVHPATGLLQAASSSDLRRRWLAIDPAIAPDLQRLEALAAGGEFSVAERSRDDGTWVVSVTSSDGSGKTYLYDRASGQARLWYDSRAALAGRPLAPTRRLEITSRDGRVMPGTLTLPTGSDADGDGKPEPALPLVLLLQGGPWSRDDRSLHVSHQWLANRGYAVLSVRARGAAGPGGSFANAADPERLRKTNDDLLDAVEWAARNGVARRDRVALVGGSQGGYAAWVGLSMTPTDYACGVSVGGPSNAATLAAATAAERSPPSGVDRIERPLLIGQGATGVRVEQSASEQIVSALQARRVPVTYVLYPDEGHAFARHANRISFHAVTEQFLAGCLGGRAEAVGDDFKGASIQVPAGAELMPAVMASLPPPVSR